MELGDGDCEHAARGLREGFRLGPTLCDGVDRGEFGALEALRELDDGLLRLGHTERQYAFSGADRRARGASEGQPGHAVLDEASLEARRHDQSRQEFGLDLLEAEPFGRAVRLLARLDLQRQHLPKDVAGRADLGVDVLRLAAMA